MPKRKYDTFQRDYLGTMSQLLLVMWAVTSAAPLLFLDFVDQLRNVERPEPALEENDTDLDADFVYDLAACDLSWLLGVLSVVLNCHTTLFHVWSRRPSGPMTNFFAAAPPLRLQLCCCITLPMLRTFTLHAQRHDSR